MSSRTTRIDIYDKRENKITAVAVEQLGSQLFKLTEYVGPYFRVRQGEVFKTRLNKDGQHELLSVLKGDKYTERVFLSPVIYEESIYRPVADEIAKQGGYLDIRFDHAIVVVLPRTSTFDPVQLFLQYNMEANEV